MTNYSNVAAAATLTSNPSNVATTITVDATTGFPAAPFTLALDYDGGLEELVSVTGVSGLTLTITRGYDGTTAQAHSAGAVVRHVFSAKDFADSRTHESSTAAHGATGAVVGTTNTQALTNKDLTSNTNIFPGSLATDAEVATALTAAEAYSDAALTTHAAATVTHGATGAVVGTTNTQALTHKDLTDATNTFPAALATLTGTQTLTNKTLTSPTINTPTISSPTITGVGSTQRVVKGSDQTVNNSTTAVADNALVFTVVTPGTYIFDLSVVYQSAVGTDIKMGFTAPTGTLTASGVAPDVSVHADPGVATWMFTQLVVAGGGNFHPVGSGGGFGVSTPTLAIIKGSFIATAAGTVSFAWAQNVATSTNTKVLAGSFLTATRTA